MIFIRLPEYAMLIMEIMHGLLQLWYKWSSIQWLCMNSLHSHDFQLDVHEPMLFLFTSLQDPIFAWTRLLVWLWIRDLGSWRWPGIPRGKLKILRGDILGP